ncbi:MAG: hypothetical protein Q7W56_06785 [Candidatus Latescibacteria bacterium]|nr:hypothetical protein [Candidatus Latescibacterota bacterium]
MSDVMDAAVARFNELFTEWGIRLPPRNVAQRRRGRILKGGWAIWYLFGADDRGEYLDFYWAHRMCGDEHTRFYADGGREDLDAIMEFRRSSPDPVEDARLEAAFFAENQRIAALLEAKGFGLAGDEPGGVQMNRYLHLNPRDDA